MWHEARKQERKIRGLIVDYRKRAERRLNYERYRILAQNDFLNVSEDKFLHQLYLEEQFGANAQLEAERNLAKKKQKTGGATIGYSYDDAGDVATIGPQPFGAASSAASGGASVAAKGEKAEGSDESDSDIDMDVSIDIGKLDTSQAHELNACGRNYGMKSSQFPNYRPLFSKIFLRINF